MDKHTDETEQEDIGNEEDLEEAGLLAYFKSRSETLSIVPAPRPFAYRRPTGDPKAEEPPHPLRRRTDFDPKK